MERLGSVVSFYFGIAKKFETFTRHSSKYLVSFFFDNSVFLIYLKLDLGFGVTIVDRCSCG